MIYREYLDEEGDKPCLMAYMSEVESDSETHKFTLRVRHNAGLASCLTVRLIAIIKYYHKYKSLPDFVDSKEQLYYYKSDITHPHIYPQPYEGEDLMDKWLEYYDWNHVNLPEHVRFNIDYMSVQWDKYADIDFTNVVKLVSIYFTPSRIIDNIVSQFENTYKFDYKNLCSVLYRGNDKHHETQIASYDEYIVKAVSVKGSDTKMNFLVQTDELEFLEAFRKHFPDALFIDELPALPKFDGCISFVLPISERPDHGSKFLAALIINSKCNHLITNSGNCGLWAVLYRGHGRNIHQYLNGSWI